MFIGSFSYSQFIHIMIFGLAKFIVLNLIIIFFMMSSSRMRICNFICHHIKILVVSMLCFYLLRTPTQVCCFDLTRQQILSCSVEKQKVGLIGEH